MNHNEKIAITGAFSYTGKYITRRLLARGAKVITLTGHPERAQEFNGRVQAFPFNFEHPEQLKESLQGIDTLYNTYWVRFDHGDATYNRAVENTRTLLRAAESAGVKRIVHVSITNPSLSSPLPYFSGKALLEKDIQESGLSYAIVRPTVIFGQEDILINNITYLLRKFPVFAIPGSGDYRLQPVYVEDMADICIDAGPADGNKIIDAVGPDIFTFNEMVELIRTKIGSHTRIIHLPPGITLRISRLLGLWIKDVVLTEEEINGLTANLLISDQPPSGQTHLADWLDKNTSQVGILYSSELARHYQT